MGRKVSRGNGRQKNKMKLFIFIILLIIILTGGFLAFKMLTGNEENVENQNEENTSQENVIEQVIVEEKQVEIFSGTDRPIAVMIDNHRDAWSQAGIQDAYMVYEIIVEGTETRLMALFKGTDTETIGPVRSARHYFLDYVLEHDAIYAHFGQSPQAETDIAKLGIDNISGIYEDGTTFWRTSSKYAPHNAMTSIENLLESAERKDYALESDSDSVLNYTTDEVDLEGGKAVESVTIPHTSVQKVQYVYDEKNKVFQRFARSVPQEDLVTDEIITTKNIIIMFVDNYTLAGESASGRQGLDNIGTFDGYYLTNGEVIEIKCIKNSRSAQTIYQDLEGNEIEVSDGNTFVNICDTSTKVTFEEPEPVQEEPVQ